jgi:hypothetical protein
MKSKISENMQLNLINCHLSIVTFASFYLKNVFTEECRQANFKDFKQFGAFKGLVEQKNVVFNSFVYQLGFLARVGQFKMRVKRAF